MRESWRPNITEIFWPQSYGRQRCVFLVLHGCSTQHWESTLRSAGFSYYIAPMSVSNYTACPQLYSPVCALVELNCPELNSSVQFVGLILPSNSHALIMDTPPRLFPISGDRDVSLPLSLERPVWSSSSGNNCHPVQRSLSSGASVYESIIGSFFTSSHFISQFPPTRFPLITATRMCHLLPVHYLEWHFWPGQQVKT